MARNKFDVDESLESPFDAGHLKRTLHYIGRHKWKMLLALVLSSCASIAGLFSPKITEHVLNVIVPAKAADQLIPMLFVLGVFGVARSTKGYFWGIVASLLGVLAVGLVLAFTAIKQVPGWDKVGGPDALEK